MAGFALAGTSTDYELDPNLPPPPIYVGVPSGVFYCIAFFWFSLKIASPSSFSPTSSCLTVSTFSPVEVSYAFSPCVSPNSSLTLSTSNVDTDVLLNASAFFSSCFFTLSFYNLSCQPFFFASYSGSSYFGAEAIT